MLARNRFDPQFRVGYDLVTDNIDIDGMIVSLLEAKCADCREGFACPQLGEFSYGEFLLHGDQGTAHAMLQAMNNPAWSEIESVFPRNTGPKVALERGMRILGACAYFADPIDGQRLQPSIVCPHCHSSRMDWQGGRKIGTAEIPSATFKGLMTLSNVERQALLVAYVEAQSIA